MKKIILICFFIRMRSTVWTKKSYISSNSIEILIESLIKNQSSFVYNYFSFVFSQFSLSAVFMKFVASNWLSRRYFESSEIGLLFTQICGPRTNISDKMTWSNKWFCPISSEIFYGYSTESYQVERYLL